MPVQPHYRTGKWLYWCDPPPVQSDQLFSIGTWIHLPQPPCHTLCRYNLLLYECHLAELFKTYPPQMSSLILDMSPPPWSGVPLGRLLAPLHRPHPRLQPRRPPALSGPLLQRQDTNYNKTAATVWRICFPTRPPCVRALNGGVDMVRPAASLA